jgi:hypothetical protein
MVGYADPNALFRTGSVRPSMSRVLGCAASVPSFAGAVWPGCSLIGLAAPHIPDTADIGAYSQHVAARIYKHAAAQMPKMILEAAFGEEHVAISMRAFFAQWEQAEETLSDDDVRILDNVIQKDRGPFLFWLVNECGLAPRSHLLSLCPVRSSLAASAVRTGSAPSVWPRSMSCNSEPTKRVWKHFLGKSIIPELREQADLADHYLQEPHVIQRDAHRPGAAAASLVFFYSSASRARRQDSELQPCVGVAAERVSTGRQGPCRLTLSPEPRAGCGDRLETCASILCAPQGPDGPPRAGAPPHLLSTLITLLSHETTKNDRMQPE